MKGIILKTSHVAKIAAAFVVCFANHNTAFARVTVGPYASVSSTKGIKPNKMKSGSEETTTQRTTYGLRIGVRMSRFFNLGIDGGTNRVDTNKKASAMRDEYNDINFQKDLNVDPSNGGYYRYQEEQRIAKVQLVISPINTRILTVKAGAGVRARQRLIKVTDKVDPTKNAKVTDPIRYHATAMGAVEARLLRAFKANIQYNFYFIKFPKTQPHEQEVSVGFGAEL